MGWGGEQRKDGAKFVIKAEFHPSSLPTPSAPASSNSSLPFKSGCGCHNGRSSPHLSAGQEATAEKDPGPDYAPFTFKTCSTPVHMLARSALSSDCKLKIWKGSSLKHVAIITSFKTVGRFSLAGLSMGHVKMDTIM